MAFPTLTVAHHELKVPSTGKTISFRPFTMREEKTLLMALEDGKPSDLVRVAYDLVNICTEGKINELNPLFDVQYAFIQIRAKSVGEQTEFVIVCGQCEGKSTATVDLSKIQVEHLEGHSNTIELSPGLWIQMKYPTIERLQKIVDQDTSYADTFALVASCIDSVYTDEEIFSAADDTIDNAVKFVENLTLTQFEKIRQFFTTMPVLRYELNYECSKCHTQNTLYLEGIESFFG